MKTVFCQNLNIVCDRPVFLFPDIIMDSMITILAVSFLVNFCTMPLSLLIPQLESQSFVEGTALVSLVILLMNLLEKGIFSMIIRFLKNRENQRRFSQ